MLLDVPSCWIVVEKYPFSSVVPVLGFAVPPLTVMVILVPYDHWVLHWAQYTPPVLATHRFRQRDGRWECQFRVSSAQRSLISSFRLVSDPLYRGE